MSLLSLELRDFVIVRELDLDFSQGFTVLTGETGAGKSILIDALQLVLGARADAGVVREGAAKTVISARFSCSPANLAWLEEQGYDTSEELLLRRSIDAQGKSRAWINGTSATVTQLRELGSQLIDIHGQHAWQSLTRPAAVRELLDAYGNVQTGLVAQAWQQWREASTRHEQAAAQQASLQQERERLLWQISELDKLAPQPGEWPELNAQHSRASNAQTLIEAAQTSTDLLDGGDTHPGLLGSLSSAIDTLEDQQHIEPSFSPVLELLHGAQAQLEEALHGLRAYLRHTEHDEAEVQRLDERMGSWLSLAKRFRILPDELADTLAAWRQQLQALDEQADLEALAHASEAARVVFEREATVLTRQRHQAAATLASEVTAAMQELGMAGGRFEVAIQPQSPGPTGVDEVEFLVAGHSGVTPRAMAKVASGGELSRIALAIAVKTSVLGQAQTLIFDEVDSGVGGAVAASVGALMHQLGQDRQVLAVTHLPQVAAMADHHLLVQKRTEAGQTVSELHALSGERRVQEIARMLGGSQITKTTLEHAQELLITREQPRARSSAGTAKHSKAKP